MAKEGLLVTLHALIFAILFFITKTNFNSFSGAVKENYFTKDVPSKVIEDTIKDWLNIEIIISRKLQTQKCLNDDVIIMNRYVNKMNRCVNKV